MNPQRLYVCDTYDDLTEVSGTDRRVYRTREDAEKRAMRYTRVEDGVTYTATVRELEACWEPDDAARYLVQRTALYLAWANSQDENAKLRELVSEYITVADNLCRDGFLCGSLSHCRYYEECGGKFYCKPGELKQKAESLGIEVPDGRA